MQLKRWESPRQEGRNDKGRGGSARKRQLKKQRQMLRNKLKENQQPNDHHNNNGGKVQFSPIFWPFLPTNLLIIPGCRCKLVVKQRALFMPLINSSTLINKNRGTLTLPGLFL